MASESFDLAHRRAQHALERVQNWGDAAKMVQEVKGLPVAVRSLGLAQSVAMLARRNTASGRLADDLASWLLSAAPARPLGGDRGGDARNLVEQVVAASPEAARAAEEEAVLFCEALKLFGELVYG